MSEKVISSTTQEFLDVYDIVNNVVLLKDGTASIILQVGTMNFSLLAEQEQDAIIFTYGSLLNSLNYPIQISIQSQTKDVTKYLRLLDEQIQKASTDRKAALIKQYRSFVATLIKERNVLEKLFYITIPASPAEMGLITPSNVLPGKTTFDITTIEKSIILEKAINLLEPRRDHLTAQFNRLGLYTRQLNTQEIIQNFYINYNPEATEGQEISNNENYTTPLVRASFGGQIMQNNNAINNEVGNMAGTVMAPNLEGAAAQTPSPEEILSNEPLQQTNIGTENVMQPPSVEPTSQVESTLQTNPVLQAEPTLQAEPALRVETAPQATPIPPVEQAVQMNQTEQVASVEPTLKVEPAQEEIAPASTESNPTQSLNLNPNFIDGNQPAQNLENPPTEVTNQPTAQAAPEAPAPTAPSAAPDSFAEDITPLQGKLEQPTVETQT